MVASKRDFFKLALIGHPVAHSLSPRLHQAALFSAGLKGSYELIDVAPQGLAIALSKLVDEGYHGFNVTVPHKEAVFAAVDELTDEARKTGAVNTVKITAGHMIGHNTDLGGFVGWLSALEVKPESANAPAPQAILLGAGGAARSVLWGLLQLGFGSIAIVCRNEQSGIRLIDTVIDQMEASGAGMPLLQLVSTGDVFDTIFTPGALLVNATTCGLRGEALPDWICELVRLSSPSRIIDVVYTNGSEPTPLVALASRQKIPACDGKEMLVRQARLAFQFWTDKNVPLEVMDRAIEGT